MVKKRPRTTNSAVINYKLECHEVKKYKRNTYIVVYEALLVLSFRFQFRSLTLDELAGAYSGCVIQIQSFAARVAVRFDRVVRRAPSRRESAELEGYTNTDPFIFIYLNNIAIPTCWCVQIARVRSVCKVGDLTSTHRK